MSNGRVSLKGTGKLNSQIRRLTAELKLSRGDKVAQFTNHISLCKECHKYPDLCVHGRRLHQEIYPQYWDGDKPTR